MSDPAPRVGQLAPDFTLPDQHGQRVTLSEVTAKRHALLVFYPFAFSSICTGELLEIQLNIDQFSNDAVEVFGVSCDPGPALRTWAAQDGYRFPLLSDFWPHGQVARDYGVFYEEAGMATRGTFLVDTDRVVRWSLINGPGEQREIGVLHRAVTSFVGSRAGRPPAAEPA